MSGYPRSALRVFAVVAGSDAQGARELVTAGDAELGVGPVEVSVDRPHRDEQTLCVSRFVQPAPPGSRPRAQASSTTPTRDRGRRFMIATSGRYARFAPCDVEQGADGLGFDVKHAGDHRVVGARPVEVQGEQVSLGKPVKVRGAPHHENVRAAWTGRTRSQLRVRSGPISESRMLPYSVTNEVWPLVGRVETRVRGRALAPVSGDPRDRAGGGGRCRQDPPGARTARAPPGHRR
jgi:hypothetical protein